MIGQTISHYRVLGEIGEGGMGVVYRAQDVRLGRQVALKFLPPDLTSSPDALARFRREAELISSLNHPHICTLYDVGEHEGRQYLVLELVEGETLKRRITGQPLPTERVIALGMDIAEALDAAHAKGIVHRDVKPANILIASNGDAKLVDFGIAKRSVIAVPGDRDLDVTQAAVTRAGDWIGTPDYMSPEQVRGEAVDARTDVFALGAVLFEMATGRAPFTSPTVTATVDAVLHREPARPAALNPHVPVELERIILKALEKDGSLRYQTAREIATDLRRLTRGTGAGTGTGPGTGAAPPRRGLVVVAVAALIALSGLVAWLMMLRGHTPAPAADSGAPARLVVLPFENRTGQPADDWLAGAFSDAISAALQPIETLILVPRARILELYAAESRRESQALSFDLARQVSSRLKVRYYVHGSYERVGDDLRVWAQLVDVNADSTQDQVQETDRFANVLALEDRLASKLALRLTARAALGASKSPGTTDLIAYQLVSEARGHYAVAQWDDALPLLEEAVKRDARYALAWAMLSKTHSRANAPSSATAPDPAVTAAALREASQAVELSPTLVEAQIALALAYREPLEQHAMRAAAEHAIVLDPRNGEARILLGDSFSSSPAVDCPTDSNAERALVEYREGLRIDPLENTGYGNLTTQLWWLGRPVEALEAQERALANQPDNAATLNWLPFNMVFAGRVNEAEAILAKRAGPSVSGRDELIYGYIALARKQFAAADERFKNAEVKGAFGSLAIMLITSVAEFQAGRPDRGGGYLARGVRLQRPCAEWAKEIPVLAPFRDTPQFKAAVRQR